MSVALPLPGPLPGPLVIRHRGPDQVLADPEQPEHDGVAADGAVKVPAAAHLGEQVVECAEDVSSSR